MKCPVCKAKIGIYDKICKNCKTNLDDYADDKKDYEKERNRTAYIIGIIITIIIGSIFIIPSLSDLRETNLEAKLIQEGKSISSYTVIEEIAECLKNNDSLKLKTYMSEDCEIYNDSKKNYSVETALNSLSSYDSYRIETRGNSIKDEDTYRIYWNGNNIDDSTEIITVILKKKTTKQNITYEIISISIIKNK